MQIFLIAGKARSGKNEVAKIIKHYYDKKDQKSILTEYSKYVKLLAKEMTNWDGNTDNKPRTFLQEMGDFIRNDMNMPFFFIDRMKEDIKIYQNFYDNIVISDVRFPNEIKKIKQNHSKVYSFYIINEHGESNLSKKEASHISETALDHFTDFDFVIVNREKKGLIEKIEKILEKIDKGV